VAALKAGSERASSEREARILVLNAGSATLKSTLLDLPALDTVGTDEVAWLARATPSKQARTIVDALKRMDVQAAAGGGVVDAVGHRVVHGGDRFTRPTRIDRDNLAAIERLNDLAPLHNPVAVATIRAALKALPDVPHVAVFDTAFHATLPEVARRYAIPDAWVDDHGIRRYGFHGLSVAWAVRRAGELLERDTAGLRLIVAHLGGGCSVTAVDGGTSVDTSMGLTPLEGLMMGTRAGSIDPGIVFHLAREGLSLASIENGLAHESGLRGVGGTDDVRALLRAESGGDARATLAIELFVRRAAAGIAAAATTLPALDAVVFTGGIGERAASVRTRICGRLARLGISAPGDAETTDGVLTREATGPAILVVHSREDIVIAEAAAASLSA
jgi:acetate kinase